MSTLKKSAPSLLEYLAEELQCLYLSDLKSGYCRPSLWRAVQAVPAEQYPEKEWRDALQYLTGLRPKGNVPGGILKDLLTDWLKENGGRPY